MYVGPSREHTLSNKRNRTNRCIIVKVMRENTQKKYTVEFKASFFKLIRNKTSLFLSDTNEDKHECFVFISDKLAEEITLTIGQAFELAYK